MSTKEIETLIDFNIIGGLALRLTEEISALMNEQTPKDVYNVFASYLIIIDSILTRLSLVEATGDLPGIMTVDELSRSSIDEIRKISEIVEEYKLIK